MNLSNFERWWREFRTNAGFEGLRFHELRHTQATQLLANGVDLKTAQDRMGHANGAITLNWYAHAVPENDAKAAQLVGDLFDTQNEQEPEKKRKLRKRADFSESLACYCPLVVPSAPDREGQGSKKAIGISR